MHLTTTLRSILSLALATVLLVGVVSSPPQSAAAQTPTPAPSETPPLPGEREEDVSRRSVYSKTYSEPDGTTTVETFVEPIHFQVADGSWKEIDNTIVADADGSGFENKAGDLDVDFAASGASGSLLSVADGAKAVTLALGGGRDVQPVTDGNAITYPDIFPGMDLVYEVHGDSVKELLVLKERPNIPAKTLDFRFPLSATGLTAKQVGGEVEFTNANGDTVFSIPKLFMYDSAADAQSAEPAFSENITLTVVDSGGSQHLKVAVDGAWLTASERVYPVIIDPTIWGRQPSLDTYVQSNIVNTPQDTASELKSGTYDSGTTRARSLLKFDLSDVPFGSTINDSVLSLYENHSWSCNASQVDVYRVTSWWGSNVVWDTKPTFAGSAAASKTVAKGYSSSCAADWVDFNVTSVVSYWKNSDANNYGFGVRAYNESVSNGWKKFASDNATNKPKLMVNYTQPNNAPGEPTPVSPLDGAVTGPQPTLKAIFRDSDSGDWGKVFFQVWRGADCSGGTCSGTPAASGDGSGTNPGGESSWQVPANQLADDQVYKWRGRGDDGKATGPWSTNQTFTVDVPPPPPPSIDSSPATPSNNTNPAWGFSGQAGVSFQCQLLLNGAMQSAWAACTSPKSYSVSQNGTYNFEVRQINSYGVTSSATRSGDYVLDTVAPGAARITASPTSPGNNATPSWSFDRNGETNTTLHCRLERNGAIFSDWTTGDCPSPKSYSLIDDGDYRFLVRQKDPAGNYSSSVASTYVLDRAVPAAPQITSSPVSPSSDRNPSWSFSGESGARFECRLIEPASTPAFAPCEPPTKTYNISLTAPDGPYTFEVRQTDAAGNGPSLAAQSTYILDSQAPPPPEITAGPPKFSNDETPTWAFSGESGATFACELRRGIEPVFPFFTPCNSPQTYNLAPPREDGAYTFAVTQRDSAGNASGEATESYTLDRTSPDDPAGVVSKSHVPGVAFKDNMIDVTWTKSSDNASGIKEYWWAFRKEGIDGSKGAAADGICSSPDICRSPAEDPNAVSAALDDGRYWFHMRAVDKAGNISNDVVYGPLLVDQNGSVFPLAPSLDELLVANSDTNGLEQFYPYRSTDLGTATAYTNLHRGNVVVQQDDVTIPAVGLNTVIRHTYNSQRADAGYHDTGLGRGWVLSLSDVDTALDFADGAVTDLDLNSPVIPTAADVVDAVVGATGQILELTDGDGTAHRFVRKGDPGTRWESPPGVGLRVQEVLDSTTNLPKEYRLVRPDGITYVAQKVDLGQTGVPATWHIRYVEDRNGNHLRFDYTYVEAPTSLTDVRVASVHHSSAGEIARFQYNASGYLQRIVSLPGASSADPGSGQTRSYERWIDFIYDPDRPLLTEVVENTHALPAGAVDGTRSTKYAYTDFTNPDLLNTTVPLLTGVTDGRGNRTSFDYSSSTGIWRMTNITDRRLREWTYDYGSADPNTGDRTTTATTPGPSKATSYRISGRARISDADKRPAGGNILRIADAGSPDPVVSSYRWSHNRLVESADGAGATTNFTYNDLGLMASVTHPAPNVSRDGLPATATTERVTSRLEYDFPASFRYAADKCTDPAPSSEGEAITNDGYCAGVGELVRTSFADSVPAQRRITDFSFNASGNLKRVVERSLPDADQDSAAPASSTDRSTTFSYNPRGSLASVDGPRGVNDVTSFVDYDRTGMPRTITDALGNQRIFVYSPYGLVAKVIDRDANVTKSIYDERDNLIDVIDPVGRIASYTYDDNDNKETETSPRGTATTSVANDFQTVYTYNANDWLTQTAEPGATPSQPTLWTTTYNHDGSKATESGPVANATTTYGYHPNGSLQEVLVAASAGQTAKTTYVYDAAGRVSLTRSPEATATGARPEQTLSYTPRGDVAVGRQTSAVAGADRVTQYAYNAHGEPLQTLGPRSVDGVTAQALHEYDVFGQVISTKRRLTASHWIDSTNGYDLGGNAIRATQATGQRQQLVSTYAYDALNQLSEQTNDPVNPQRAITYRYSGEGQQIKRVERDKSTNAPIRTFEHTYNPDNTQQSMVATDHDTGKTLASCNWGPGKAQTSGYDADGNLEVTRTVSGTDGCQGGTTLRTQSFVYDHRGWMDETTQTLRSPSTGQNVSRTQTFAYRADGERSAATWSGHKVEYSYSPGGWMESLTDWRDRASTVSYLPSGMAKSQSLGNGVATSAFTYHPDGMPASLVWSDSSGTAVRSHTDIAYDIGGLRTSEAVKVVHPAGSADDDSGTARYGHDLLNRLTSWTSPFKLLATDTTDPTSTYRLDDGGNITKETIAVGDQTRGVIDMTYEHGRLTSRADERFTAGVSEGKLTDTFGYNRLGEETERKLASTVEGIDSKTVTSTYDPKGYTRSVDDSSASEPKVTYHYDTADRLIARVETPDVGSEKTTLYFYSDTGGSLIEEADGDGNTTVRYLLDSSGGPLAQQRYKVVDNKRVTSDTTGEWTWLLNDAQGNVATHLKDDGSVAGQIAFSPFGDKDPSGSGQVVGHDGSTLGFQGAITDPATKKVVLGARLFDPKTARFTTPDVFVAGALDLTLGTDSLTGNRYIFAGANPVAFYDDGHWGFPSPFNAVAAIAKAALPVLAFVPVVGTAIDVVSAATGRDWLDGGRKMSGGERLLLLGGAALGAVTGGIAGPAIRAARFAAKSVDRVATTARAGSRAVARQADDMAAAARKAPRPRGGETSATKYGREMHKEWEYGPGFKKEYVLPSGRRPDAVNFETRQIVELKPNNPRAIRRGERQLDTYRKELEIHRPGQWSTRIETYKRPTGAQ